MTVRQKRWYVGLVLAGVLLIALNNTYGSGLAVVGAMLICSAVFMSMFVTWAL